MEQDYTMDVPEGRIGIAPGFVEPKLGYDQFFNEFREKAEEEIKRVLG